MHEPIKSLHLGSHDSFTPIKSKRATKARDRVILLFSVDSPHLERLGFPKLWPISNFRHVLQPTILGGCPNGPPTGPGSTPGWNSPSAGNYDPKFSNCHVPGVPEFSTEILRVRIFWSTGFLFGAVFRLIFMLFICGMYGFREFLMFFSKFWCIYLVSQNLRLEFSMF